MKNFSLSFICICSCYILLQSHISLAIKADFYSIFSPKLSWRRIQDYFQSESQLETLENESDLNSSGISDTLELMEVIDDFIIDEVLLVQTITRIFSGVDALIEKYRRILTKDENVLISLPSWPFGWKNYLFKVSVRDQMKKSSDVLWIDLNDVHKSTFSIRIKILQKKLSFSYYYDNLRVKLKDSQQILPLINQFLRSRLSREIQIARARINQHSLHLENASKYKKARQKVQLDRIINPDKYKSKSATVRRASSSSSTTTSNRYKPSSAAAARRVVRK